MYMQIFNCAGVGTPKELCSAAVDPLYVPLCCVPWRYPGEFALMAGVLQLWGEGCNGWTACRRASPCTSFSLNPCPANRSGGENLPGLPVPAPVSSDSCI